MARHKKLYLYEFGDELPMGNITEKTKVTFEKELELFAESENGDIIKVGQIGEIEKDDQGLISNCLIRNDEIDLDTYKEKLKVEIITALSDVDEEGNLKMITIDRAILVSN